MPISRILMLKGTIWTIASFSVAQILRVGTNIVLTRLLAPELFGIMQIVNSLRTGIELVSDVGVGANIVYSRAANDPEFYNTAWSLQLLRGILLWIVFCLAAIPVARFYQSSILGLVIPIAGFNIVLNGFTSVSIHLLQKRMLYRKISIYNTIVGCVSSAALVVLAFFRPTIWALVFGTLIGTATATVGSFFLLPDVRNRFAISKRYTGEILSFGKWIFASSLIFFLSNNFDRLYLAKTIPLDLLGIYGLARSLSELVGALVVQLGNNVVFPMVASNSYLPRAELRAQLASIRVKFLLAASFGLALLTTTADLAIRIIYDQRYQAAGWMLPVLLIGAWFAVLPNFNESSLLGIGRPHYTALANSAKFAFILLGLTWSVSRYGVLGEVIVVAAGDLWRYFPVLIGQVRERLSFATQDAILTLGLFAQIAFLEWLRWSLGFGTSFGGLPTSAFGLGA